MMVLMVLTLFLLQSVIFSVDSSITPSLNSSSTPSQRYALCFFGLTRSLRYTHHSLNTRIFQKLLQENVKYDIYLHTFNRQTISNPRSGEFNVTLDPEEWKLLLPHKYVMDDNELFEISVIEPLMSVLLRHGDPWNELPPHSSIRNFLKQLYSIYRVTNLWIHQEQNYDLIFYLRPDVWFFNDINLIDIREALQAVQPVIYVPNFHHWGGINDRFAFGSPKVMKLYGSRYLQAINYSQYFPLHAETFLRYFLDYNGIVVRMTDILFERVRSNGVLWGIPQGGTFPENISEKYQLKRNSMGQWEAIPIGTGLPIKLGR